MPKQLTAYSFSELSEEAKKKAIENNRYFEVEYWDWWEYTFEWYATEKMPEECFEAAEDKDGDPKIYFSGFYSQGDGASFEAGVDLHKFMLEHGLCNEYRSLAHWVREGYAWCGIKRSGHYYHRYSMYAESHLESYAIENIESADRAAEQLEEVAEIVIQEARDLALKLYRDLEKEYEYRTSDECISEALESNDHILFWDTGTPV